MISEKAEKLMSDLRHVVHSASGFNDEFLSTEFEIRMYFLANYIEGLEIREADYKKRIVELEKQLLDIEILEDQQREVKNILIDKNLHIDSLYEEGYKLQQRIAELEGKIDQLTAHGDIERQERGAA